VRQHPHPSLRQLRVAVFKVCANGVNGGSVARLAGQTNDVTSSKGSRG
jgi:hypothetical protein